MGGGRNPGGNIQHAACTKSGIGDGRPASACPETAPSEREPALAPPKSAANGPGKRHMACTYCDNCTCPAKPALKLAINPNLKLPREALACRARPTWFRKAQLLPFAGSFLVAVFLRTTTDCGPCEPSFVPHPLPQTPRKNPPPEPSAHDFILYSLLIHKYCPTTGRSPRLFVIAPPGTPAP